MRPSSFEPSQSQNDPSSTTRRDRRGRGRGRGRGCGSGRGRGRGGGGGGGSQPGAGRGERGGSHGSGDFRREWVPRPPVAIIASHTFSPIHDEGSSDANLILPIPNGCQAGIQKHRSNRSNQRPRIQTRRSDNDLPMASSSPSIPQLAQEIQDKLSKGSVECMICCDMVGRTAAIWSCSSCYSIFHLSCIKKWARSLSSKDTSSAVETSQRHGNWRCPGCQSVQITSAKDIQYFCFCGKCRDPPNDFYLTSHSCGEPCGKALDNGSVSPITNDPVMDDTVHRCPHVCVLQCHPGPCPPCKAFAPRQLCPCGKDPIVRRCSDRKTPLSCGKPCNRLLSCGRHQCESACHVGPCDSCAVPITASCFCKKKTEIVLCGEMAVKGEVKGVDGIFSCSAICGKTLSCGNHLCNYDCHPGQCGECELSPNLVKTCYCGKTELTNSRNSCLDPIPTCSEPCGKTLLCGIHQCRDKCHDGVCGPCLVPVNQKCQCGSTSRMIDCSKACDKTDPFVCVKPCGRKKNCGRHRCKERCCPLYSGNINNIIGEWDPHLCQIPCDKRLRCGQHSCQSLCHSGHCPPCLETIFTELTCSCGRTSIPPPLPCGTPFPSCPESCIVPQQCGHSSTHTCHFGPCPPCPIPVAKECVGSHLVLSNVPCGSKDIRCSQLCGKPRQCGLHACTKTCHPAPCDSSSASCGSNAVSCGQTCGAPRIDCRHTCTSVCHPTTACPSDRKCEFNVTITCSCGRLSANVPCGAGCSNAAGVGFNADTIYETTIIQRLPAPLQTVEGGNGRRIPLGQRKLTCNEECAKLERNRALADAFDITPPNLNALHFGENSIAFDSLNDFLRRDPKWVMACQERFKWLVLGKKTKGSSGIIRRAHVFCPMIKEKRDVLTMMAERWKLGVKKSDWEPKRFLTVYVTSKSTPPASILGSKPGIISTANVRIPVFDSLVDMDPRLVISFLDMQKESDMNALMLRFGTDCILVWLDGSNALAVFSDIERAATVLKWASNGSAYQGAVVFPPNGGGISKVNVWGARNKELMDSNSNRNSWKKVVVAPELNSWGGGAGSSLPLWNVNDAPITASINQFSVLQSSTSSSSHFATATAKAQQSEVLLSQEVEDWEDVL
ncbi:NF-X1-type zinc finger protein NFXL1 [Zostera marina]|uniref:NF-X1-type zinc finger protein NFXL1 n=1 Tax=Zostera marina TaxID=29655 RepID=A0A0K9PAU4_ZOSMR|nr:NF-X1-type zinc finger protein NFXL1 [Zostera marina]